MNGKLLIALMAISMIYACRSSDSRSLTTAEKATVVDSVQRMAEAIAHNVSANGPEAWLPFFDDSPAFFMASEGGLEFPDYLSAKTVITDTLKKKIRKIALKWSNIRVDPLSNNIAGFAASFHEVIIDTLADKTTLDGYMTAIARQSANGWVLRNAHWSFKSN